MVALHLRLNNQGTQQGQRDKTKITAVGKISAPLKCCCTENALMLLDPMKWALELKKKKGEKSESSVEWVQPKSPANVCRWEELTGKYR